MASCSKSEEGNAEIGHTIVTIRYLSSTYMHTYTYRHMHAHIQADGQTDRQADKHADIHTVEFNRLCPMYDVMGFRDCTH